MEMEQEFGLLAHFIVAGALFYMGWSVLEEDLTAAQFLLIYNVRNCVEIKFRAPNAIDATCSRSCICAMAWRFHTG